MQDRPRRDIRPDGPSQPRYDTDFNIWCQEQARLLRAGRLVELDIENIAEELESMGRSDRREIRSRLEVLIAHLLKWRMQPGARSASWRSTIREQRRRIEDIVADSPSLRGYPESMIGDSYEAARLTAAGETGIDFALFPEACPFTSDEVLDPDFLPVEGDREQKSTDQTR